MVCGVYLLEHEKTNDIYIGSSKSVEERINTHFKHYDFWLKSGKQYCSSFKLLQYGKYGLNCLLLEESDENELKHKERWWLDWYKGLEEVMGFRVINIHLPFRSDEETKEYMKNYYKDNQQSIKQRINLRYDEKKEEINKNQRNKYATDENYRTNILQKQKEYVEKNKDVVLERQRKKYERRKDVYNAKKRERVMCDKCKKDLSRGSYSNHKQKCK
jgi:hypothetical protein